MPAFSLGIKKHHPLADLSIDCLIKTVVLSQQEQTTQDAAQNIYSLKVPRDKGKETEDMDGRHDAGREPFSALQEK